ncbi:MAG: carboxypeptidase regulatory-like domain-containing protein [Chitinispirillaceae bacterium]|nr:carboxypeptidase regulatory-like domain-containing protein [Chitinispirillaceae bacterium]
MFGNAQKIRSLSATAILAALAFTQEVTALPLRGIVSDSLGNRHSAATVELYEPDQGTPVYSIQADTAGYFEFSEVTEMDYQIKVTTQTYPAQWFSYWGNTVYRQYLTRIDIAETPDTLYIPVVSSPTNNPPDNTLIISITDSSGGTLQNQSVYVALLRQKDFYELQGKNSSAGTSIIFDTLQAASYAIMVRSSNYPPQYFHPDRNTSQPKYWLPVSGGQSYAQTVKLVDPAVGDGGFRGICLSETDAPLAGITVAICRPGDTFRVVYSQTTDAGGFYSFVNIMETNYYLKFSGNDYPVQWYSMERNATTRYPESSIWSMHAVNDTMTIRLSTSPIDNPALGTVIVSVKDTNGINLAPPGIVELIDAKTKLSYSPGFDTTSRNFIVQNIPAGEYSIKLIFPPYPTQYYSPTNTTNTPAYYFTVSSNGSFSFDIQLSMNPGQTSVNAYGFLKGIIRDSNGVVSNATITIFNLNYSVIQSVNSMEDGSFGMLRLPVQEMCIGIRAGNYPLQYWSSQGMTFAQTTANRVFIVAGDTISIEANLIGFNDTTGGDTSYHPTATTTITGKVYDASNNAGLRGARIVLFDFTPDNYNSRYLWSPWIAYTDSNGTFVLNNVPSGTYRCMAEADSLNFVAQFYPKANLLPNATILIVDSTTASLALDFSLRKGGMVGGSVVDMNGAPISGAYIDVRCSDNSRWFQGTTGSDGSYRVPGVPRGVWNVWASHDAYLTVESNEKREYTVTEGTTLQVPVFQMEKGGRISGSFTSQISLTDMSFDEEFLRGNLSLFKDTTRGRDEQLWPEFTGGITFETTSSNGLSGMFKSSAIRPGAYRMIFSPHPKSWDNDTTATTNSVLPGLGYSFVGGNTSFGALATTTITAGDTVLNLTLALRKGFSVFGTLRSENNTVLTGSYGVNMLIRQDSAYICIGNSVILPDGRFELPGLIDDEDYYLMLWADGYPGQFWSTDGNTAYPSQPFRFSAATYTPLHLTIVRNPAGMDPDNVQGPISLWIEGDSLGCPLLSWNSDPSLLFENFVLYSSDRLGKISPIAKLPRTTSSSMYKYRDLRTAINFREYIVVGKGGNLLVRSNRTGFDPRNSSTAATTALWLEVYNDLSGIELEWGSGKSLTFTEKDSVNVYRSIGTETPKLLFRRSAWETRINDYTWRDSDSGTTFSYFVELPGRQLASPSVSKTLDAGFFVALAKKLTVGPYETYRRIADAIAAASDFDHIEVRPGTYIENITFAGKNISINGSWDYGKPPVIDGGGGVAVTIPYCKYGGDWDRPRISGFTIRNSSIGIKAQSPVDVEACLFDNVSAAVTMSIDSGAMLQQMIANPFSPSVIEADLRHCTFIAKKSGSLVATVTAIGIAEQAGYSGPYSGYERFYITPSVSLSSAARVERSIIAFYQSNGLQTTLPAMLQGNTSRISFERCNIWKTSMTPRSVGIETREGTTSLNPRFIDSTWWFIAAASPLAGTTWESRIGYDVWNLYGEDGPSDENRPTAVRNVTAAAVGLNAVLVRWSASPAGENVKRYRIYRAPGDPALYYINQESQWDLKIPEDSMFSVIDSFSTEKTVFLDTTVEVGIPYLYVVAAVNADGNEGRIGFPAPPDISTYFVNNPVDRLSLTAGKWYMIGAQGASTIRMNADSRHAVFGWDDKRPSDKTLSHYTRDIQLQSTRGYWFKAAIDTVLTINTASLAALKSIETTVSVNIVRGETGWNLISSPFPFAIVPDWLGSFTAWEWNTDSLGYRQAQTLRPWRAYWVYTDRDTALQLWKKQPLSYYQSKTLAKVSATPVVWRLRLTLQDEMSWDTDNFIGIVPAALAKVKQLAIPEPPAAFGAARLYIIGQHSDDASTAGQPAQLASLYKAVSGQPKKLEWLIGITASERQSVVTISDINDVPEDLFAFWVEENRVINLREQSAITVAPHSADRFGYIVITGDPGDLALYSGRLTLRAPFPNPFRGTATIEYLLPYAWTGDGAIPGSGNVPFSLSLYDITGKHIRKLVDEPRGPGIYRTVWNGESSSGRQAAAGMYIMRLKYGKNMKTARLYRVR